MIALCIHRANKRTSLLFQTKEHLPFSRTLYGQVSHKLINITYAKNVILKYFTWLYLTNNNFLKDLY